MRTSFNPTGTAENYPGSSPGSLPLPTRERVLPGGNSMPPLVCGSVQHVDTASVHMLGHLEDLIEFVVQGRFASRSGQRIFTRSQSKFVCTHNEYWYTSVRMYRKCANLTITRPQRGQRASPLDHTLGYPQGERTPPPTATGPLSATKHVPNRPRSRVTKVAPASQPVKSPGDRLRSELQFQPADHPFDCSPPGGAALAGTPSHLAL